MRKKLFFLLFLIVTSLVGFSQNKPAYVIYNAKGKQVGYQKMIADLAKKDIILFGESHNNPISHWLEYEVTADLAKQKPMVLGAEMMEADNQEAVDKYLKGEIDEEQLPKEARLWLNYATDYAPLLNFAKEKRKINLFLLLPIFQENMLLWFLRMIFKL